MIIGCKFCETKIANKHFFQKEMYDDKNVRNGLSLLVAQITLTEVEDVRRIR